MISSLLVDHFVGNRKIAKDGAAWVNLAKSIGVMKVVILAGGYGTRLSEETRVAPKPLVEIGGQPILWHIMKIYSAHGLTTSSSAAATRAT